MKSILIATVLLLAGNSFAQTRLILVGDVKDSATNDPLAYATIGVKNFTNQAVTNAEGKFELSLPAAAHADTLVITYVGYEKFEKPIPQLSSFEHVLLKEFATVLNEVTVIRRQLAVRSLDKYVKVVRGNIYAAQCEVTNADYNLFLEWLEDYNKTSQREHYDFDLDGYKKSVQEFYLKYHKPSAEKQKKRRTNDIDSIANFNNYPAVNISYESATEYCKWLTERYNESPTKKKFKKVLFRLPTLNEWQIAALGDDKFQSWNLLENTIEIVVQDDSLAMATNTTKGKRTKIQLTENMWYPWYYSYYYRNKAYNFRGCYLGNFKIEHEVEIKCPANPVGFDGFTMMSHVASYFPNNIGLFDVVGNVAEMIDEKGKACGGSWNDTPDKSTIHSVKTYNGVDETVGFRVFMEVIEK